MNAIVAGQRTFFETGATRPVAFRLQQLKAFRQALRDHEERLCAAIREDFGKSTFDTVATELALLHHDLKESIAKVTKWSARKRVPTPLANFPARSFVIPEPLGVALVRETFAPEVFAVVEGGVAETTALLEERFDKIFFTGSVPVGRIVHQAEARHLTPVTLELGGKSPALVAADCDLEMTARRLTRAKYLNAGQTCIAPDYVLVEASIDPAKVRVGGGCDEARRLIEPTVLVGVGWEDAVLHVSNPHLPFGGVGDSGIGAYHGEEGFRAFTHYKAILDKPTWFEPFLKYAPHTPLRLKWIRRLME